MTNARFGGFEPPTYTQTPNAVLDHWLAVLSGAEFKVLMYVVRRTFGFRKEVDAISLSQFADGIVGRDGTVLDEGTGLDRTTIISALARLEREGLLVVERRTTAGGRADTSLYRLRLVGNSNQSEPEYPTNPSRDWPDSPARNSGRIRPALAGQSGPQKKAQKTVKRKESPDSPSQNCARETEPPEPPAPRRDAEPRPSDDLLPTIRHLARRVANGARRAAWHRQLAADLADYVAKSPLSAAQLERLVRLVEAHGPLRTEAEFWERLDLYRLTYVQPQAVPASAIVPAEPSAHRVGSPLELAKGRRT